jgi:hypothetical protein
MVTTEFARQEKNITSLLTFTLYLDVKDKIDHLILLIYGCFRLS